MAIIDHWNLLANLSLSNWITLWVITIILLLWLSLIQWGQKSKMSITLHMIGVILIDFATWWCLFKIIQVLNYVICTYCSFIESLVIHIISHAICRGWDYSSTRWVPSRWLSLLSLLLLYNYFLLYLLRTLITTKWLSSA